MASTDRRQRCRLLHWAPIPETGETQFRVLLPGNFVSYVKVASGIIADGEKMAEAVLWDRFPLPSSNNWKCLRIFQNMANGELEYEILFEDLPSVEDFWHPRCVEYVDLLGIDIAAFKVQTTRRPTQRVVAVDSPLFPVPVIAKFALWPEDIEPISDECRGYKLVRSHDIGPQVLGHITEEGRHIGVVLEKIEGQAATMDDIDACEEALDKLHKLGLQRGDISSDHFIVRGSKATMISFREVKPLWDETLLKEEKLDLELMLDHPN